MSVRNGLNAIGASSFFAEDNSVSSMEIMPPNAMAQEAFHGPVGAIVQKMDPHTESSEAAVLVTLLVGLGNSIGRAPYFSIGTSRHHTNLYACVVGRSAMARKGQSMSDARYHFRQIDPEWEKKCISTGCASGEGVISQIIDPVISDQTVKDKGKPNRTEKVTTNAGVADKRILIHEPEFASYLKVSGREGNTLSPVTRAAWDNPYQLRAMSKGNPCIASNPHASFLGHITEEELKSTMTRDSLTNGEANRFCWVYAQRSKCLPDGGAIHEVDFSKEHYALAAAIDKARRGSEIKRDGKARDLYHSVYPYLTQERTGKFGSVISRAAPQVVRFSLLYALLDGATEIKLEHLEAALAIWKYCEDSARYIFGDACGNPDANRILVALKNKGSAGMTLTQISHEVFTGNLDRAKMSEALAVLDREKRAHPIRERGDAGGRPAERWFFGQPSTVSK